MKTYIYCFFLLISVFSAAFITSCESSTDLDLDSKPVGILNILADPDSLIYIQLSHSWNFTQRPKDVIIKDASVSLIINGNHTETATYDAEKKLYVCDFRPESGDRIQAEAITPKFGKITGETTVPQKVEITKWSYKTNIITDEESIIVGDNNEIRHSRIFVCDYNITFSDPVQEQNYYLIRAAHNSGIAGKAFSPDPILNDGISPFDVIFSDQEDLMIFSDRQINGKQYTISFQTQRTMEYLDPYNEYTDRICIFSLSEDYYLYLRSLYVKYGSGLNQLLEPIGLSEPRAIYSNISGGSGIIASQNGIEIKNDIKEKYIEAMNSIWK